MEKNKMIELKNIFDEYVHYTEDNVEYCCVRTFSWSHENDKDADDFVNFDKIEAGATTKPVKEKEK